MVEKDTSSYSRIAKSTSVFGGSQVIAILTGIVRTKVLAVWLGTAGVGLTGLYQSLIDFVKSVAGMGLSFSSVKDISEAASQGGSERLSTIKTALLRLAWWTGLA
jgi:PST family polysaccharide transporter